MIIIILSVEHYLYHNVTIMNAIQLPHNPLFHKGGIHVISIFLVKIWI